MKILKHVLFWIIVLALLTFIFGRSYKSYIESFYFVSMLLPVAIGTSYFFNYFLISKYLLKKRYLKFLLYCLYLLVVSLNLEMYVITGSFIVLAEYDYANMNPITTDVSILTITLYFIAFGLAFLRMIRFHFQNQNTIEHIEAQLEKSSNKYLIVRENRKNKQIQLGDIDYLESLGDYVKIISNRNIQVITKEKISALSNRLPTDFIRIHRSFVINKNKISSFNRESLTIGEKEFPISRTYKQSAFSSLEN